jgi:iron complex transport system substrate-binding protein
VVGHETLAELLKCHRLSSGDYSTGVGDCQFLPRTNLFDSSRFSRYTAAGWYRVLQNLCPGVLTHLLMSMTLDRIVSLEPSATATLIALGQRARLVAVSRYCGRLVDVTGLPQLGTTWSVDADEVAALSPDLVLAGIPYQAGIIDSLLRQKLNVLCLYPQTLADVYAHIGWIGRLCGAAPEAESLVKKIESHLAALSAAANTAEVRRVYVETWPDPTMNAAPWVAEIVNLLGGRSVPEPSGRQVTLDEIREADPQVILLAWAGIDVPDDAEHVRSRPGWETISAVRSGSVVVLNEILVNVPGPNLGEGAAEIWRALHPGRPMPTVFDDVNKYQHT